MQGKAIDLIGLLGEGPMSADEQANRVSAAMEEQEHRNQPSTSLQKNKEENQVDENAGGARQPAG